MAFKKKVINEIFGTVLVLSALLSTASAVDCHGKSFHCVNSTHFMICVDLGGGVSKSIDNYLIGCPTPTVCKGTNHFECEFPAPSTTLSNDIGETTLPWEDVVVTTNAPPRNTTKEYSEKYLNTESITNAAENTFTTDAMVDYTTEIASSIDGIIVTETAPTLKETILYDPTTTLEHVTQTILTENIATAAAESFPERSLVEERNNTNVKAVNHITNNTASLGFSATEQAITNTVNGSISLDVSSNLAADTRNGTVINDTRNVTKPNVLEQVTLLPDSLNTKTSFETATAIDDILTTDTDLLATDIPVVTESISIDTTASEQIMQTISENTVTSAAESTTETSLVEQTNHANDKSVNEITTDKTSLGSPATEKILTNTVNGSVASDISSNLLIETRNATVINDTRIVTKPIVLEQVTSTPDSLNTKTSFETATAIDDILTTDTDLLTTDIPVVTESILYETTASEQIMQTIPENTVTSAAESTTETPLVEQTNHANDKSVNEITTDKTSLGSPATEKILTNTVNGSVASDISSNLSIETRNATVINDTRIVTKPIVLEQVTSTPDSLNTKTSFETATAIDDILTTDTDLLTTDIPVVTESILIDTTELEQTMQTIPEYIITNAAESTTETPLVEQTNHANDKPVNEITTDKTSLGSSITEKILTNTVNGSAASDISSNLSIVTRNATVIKDTRNVTKPIVLEQVTSTPDSLNTKTSFKAATAIDDILTTDTDLLTTDIPIVTESILYETTASEQIMQTIPENTVTTAESTTETRLVEQTNHANDKPVNEITTDKTSLGSSITEKILTNTVNGSDASDISSNLSIETRNATVINDTRIVTKRIVLEQVTSTPDSLNTKTSFETATAIDDILTTDTDLLTTDIPVVPESILIDTTELEQTMKTIPEYIITNAAESTTETPLVEQTNHANDKPVNEITTNKTSLGSPTTEKILTNTVNGSVASDISSNLSIETRNATVINNTRFVTKPIVLEQVTSTPDSLITKTSFGTATAIDDILTTDRDLIKTDIPVVTESMLYDTTASEQIMQTIPENIVTSAGESTTETPLVEQKNYTNDKSENEITINHISLGPPTTEKILTNIVNGSVASNVSSNLAADTRNGTKPNVLKQVTVMPDSPNTKSSLETATAIDDILTTDTDLLTTDIPEVTESILIDTTELEQTMQTIPENIITSAAESTTETPLVEQKNMANDKSVNQIPTYISLGSPTEKEISVIVNDSVSIDVSSNLATETERPTIINETRNVTKPNVLEQVTSIPDSLNTKTSFGAATAIDDILTNGKDLLTTDRPVVTESILYNTTALKQIMQTRPENTVTSPAESTTETPLVEQTNHANEITTDKTSLGSPSAEKALANTVNDSVASDVSSNLSIETRNATVFNDTRNVTKPNILEQVTSIPDSLNTKTSFGAATAIDDILTTAKDLLTTVPVVTESILYETTASEQIMQTISENTVTNAAESTRKTPLVEQKNHANDKSVNQIPNDISLGSPTEKGIFDTVNDSISADVSSNLATETERLTIVNETRNVTKPNVLEQVTSAPDSPNIETSFGPKTAISDTLTTDKYLLTTDVIETEAIPIVTESTLYHTTMLEQTMQTILENVITTVAESTSEKPLLKQKKDSNNMPIINNKNLGSPNTEQAITFKLNGTVSSAESTNMVTETSYAAVEEETRNVTMTNLLSQATSPPDSFISETSTGTEFSSSIDYMLTTDNDRSTTDVLGTTADGVQNGENKNMSDQTTITESIKVENSVNTEQKIIMILEKNVKINPSVSSTTEQIVGTESNQLPTITNTVLTHDRIIPKYVKVKVEPTTTKPIVKTSIGIDQPMSISLEEHFPKEVYDISSTQVPLTLVTNTNPLSTDAAGQVSSKWTGDINTSVNKADILVNDLTASFKKNLLTEGTIDFAINKTETSTKKQVVSTIIKSIDKSSIKQPKPTITETSLLTATTFDTPTKKLAIVRTDNGIVRTSINTERPITATFQETGTEDDTFLTTTSAMNNDNEKGPTEKYIGSVVAPTILGFTTMRNDIVQPENVNGPGEIRPSTIQADHNTEITFSSNKLNDSIDTGIQGSSLNVTRQNSQNTSENINDVIKTKYVNIANNSPLSLNTQDAQYVRFSTENYIGASVDNIQDTKKYPKLSINDNHFISVQESKQTAQIDNFEPSTTHDFTNAVTTTTSIFDINSNSDPDKLILNGIDSLSSDTLQLAVENADTIISNPLANSLFDQSNQESKSNNASVAKHVIKVSTIGKTLPDLVRNSKFESSVSSIVLTDFKSDGEITSQDYVFTRANNTVPSKGIHSQSLDILEKTSEPPRVTETLSPFLTQLKPTIIKDNTGYKEDSILNSRINVLQPVKLTTDITTEFTVLEAVQTVHEKKGISANTLSENTSQFTIGDADHNLIQLEGNIQATEQTTRGNINIKTINDTSFDNPASNIQIMWKGETNAPKLPEVTESSSSYKSIEAERTPKDNNFITKKTIFTADTGESTSDLAGMDKIQITTESYKYRMHNLSELRTLENAAEIAMDNNSVLKTAIPLYNSPTEESAKGIVLPSNHPLFETHVKRISVNTNLHITPQTGVNQASKNISESKSSISDITYLKMNFTRVASLKNVSHSSGIEFNTSSLTHDYTNTGSMQSDLKSEDKIIINNTTPNGIQKHQTIHNITQSKNNKTSKTSHIVNKVSLGSNSTKVTKSINVYERMNTDAKTSFRNDTNATTNAKGEIVREFHQPITTEHIINPVISTTQASTKRIHPRPVSSVTENPRKQDPRDPPLNYSCINGIRGRYSDKDDCRKFYICIGNSQPIVGTCPVNTVFSDIKKLCTKNMSHCIRENQFKCPSAGRFIDFINDNVYYICVSHKNHLYRFKFQCQKGFTLNKTTIRCIENTEIESNESVSISSSDHSDDVSSKLSSSGISSSSSGSSSSSSRSSGSSSGDSDSRSSNNSSKNKKNSEKKGTKEDPEQEDNDEEVFQCEKEGKFPVRNDCRRYYLCKRTKKSQYRRKIKKCDSGDVFHKSKKRCVDAESYEC